DLLGPAEILPALAEEPQDLVHAAGIGQAQADRPVEDVLADPDVVPVAAALEGNRPDQSDLGPVVWGPGLGGGGPPPRPQGGGGSRGARRTRGAVKPLRSRTRSIVRSHGSGRKARAFSSARMAGAPTRQ